MYTCISAEPRDLLRAQPRAIDEKFCPQRPAFRVEDGERAVFLFDFHNIEIGVKFGAVVHRVSDGGDRQFIRADDAARWRIQRTDGGARYVRFHLAQFALTDDAQPLYAVFFAARTERLQRTLIFLRKREDERADPREFDAKLFGILFHHFVARNIEFRLQTTLGRIEPRMDDAAVRLARPHRNVAFPLDEADFQAVFTQFPQNRAADHAAADHHYVVHFILSLRLLDIFYCSYYNPNMQFAAI